MPENLDSLVKRFQEGIDREESFRRIYELYYRKIVGFFMAKGFDREESRDLTQECFFQIVRSLPTFRYESHFGRWVFEISRHVYFNELRKRSSAKREGWEQGLDHPPEGVLAEEARLLVQDPDPLDQAIRRQANRAFQAALEDLPEQMRRCCKLRYEHGLKYQEIATVMNVSIESVKAHLHQARKRLQQKLGEAKQS